MTAFFIYLLEVIACSALFAGCYWWVLRNGRFYQWNRFYIVAAVVLSAIIPLINIPMSAPHIVMPATTDYIAHIVIDSDEVAVVPVQPEASSISWAWLGFISCISVIFLLLVKEIVSFARILRLKHCSDQIHTPETDLYCTDDETAPFTFFRAIFWKKDVPLDTSEGRCMLRHELAHVRFGHSWDKALMQLVCCLFWMNPFFMLLRRELELVHEFAADSESVGDGDTGELSSLILCTLYPNHYHDFTSRFFQSSIKRRITMMTKNKKSPMSLLRRMSIVPVALIALYLFACKTEGRHDSDNQIYTEVDQMPTLNGKSAKDGFQEYFNETSKFSVTNASKPAGITGAMKATVVIGRDGEVGDITFEEGNTKMFESIGIDAENIKIIEDEITQILKSTSSWRPGRQGNKDVSTQMELQVGFSVPLVEVIGDKTVAEGSAIYAIVEKMPLFEGSIAEEGFRDYVGKNTNYPLPAQENGISGRVFVEFVVDADGYLKDAKITRGVDPLLDAEALRVIKGSPQWTPGYHKGEPVAVRFTFPVVFKLDGNTSTSTTPSKPQGSGSGAATQTIDGETVYTIVENMPLFNGKIAEEGFRDYVTKNTIYPAKAQENGISGRIFINFIIDENGALTHAKVAHGVDPILDAEALRVIKSSPKWTPGKQDGKKVKVIYTFPVVFKLNQ